MQKSFLYLLFYLLLNLQNNPIISQRMIDDIESQIFSDVFNSKNSITEFIELDQDGDTTRHWLFNNKGKLTKEINYRESDWSFSLGGENINNTITTKKEYSYNYLPSGQIQSIIEIKNTNGKTITIQHNFSYLGKDTITETYKYSMGELMRFDVFSTEIIKDSKLHETTQVIKNHIGDGYVKINNRVSFEYNKNDNLDIKYAYFTIDGYEQDKEPNLMEEVLSSKTKYTYDSYNRLIEIHGIEYTEEGLSKPNRDVIITYEDISTKINYIKIIYPENYTPNIIEYKIEYDSNGELNSIYVNDKIFSYIIK